MIEDCVILAWPDAFRFESKRVFDFALILAVGCPPEVIMEEASACFRNEFVIPRPSKWAPTSSWLGRIELVAFSLTRVVEDCEGWAR